MKKFTFLTSALLLSVGLSAQNVFMAEHFDYPANTPLQSNGWSAHSAGSTNPIQVVAPGLAWSQTPYLGSGIGNAALVNNTGSDENLALSSLQIDSGAVYVSFLARMNGTVSATGVFFHLGQYNNTTTPNPTSISSAFRARLHMIAGTTSDKYKLGLTFNASSAGTGETTAQDFDTSKTYLYVLKYEFVPGANNDSVSLYVFEDGDNIDVEPATPTLGPFGGTQNDLSFLQLVALRQFSSNQNVTVDGIIAQDTWNMVPNLVAAEPVSPPNATTLTVTGPIAAPVVISWSAAQNIAAPVTYEWQLAARVAGNFNSPLLVLPGDNGGGDTTLSLTIGAIDAALASLGVTVGDTVEAMWRVRAVGGTDTLFSTTPFDIDIVRGTVLAPLTPFNLLTPANNTTLVVSSVVPTPAVISWESTSAGTEPVSYTWHAILPGGSFANPLVSLSADNNGADTTLTLPISAIDSLMQSLGVNQGDTVDLDWTIEATADTTSRLATQTWRLIVVRDATSSTYCPNAPLALLVYPNPTTQFVNVAFSPSLTFGKLAVIDAAGRVLLEEVVAPHQEVATLRTENLANGSYHLQLFSNGTLQIVPFIKQ